jgi:hypothetical protein
MTRYLASAAIFVAGVCTTAMNWRFSYQLGTNEIDSFTWATFSVALDVLKWLMLPYAALAWRTHKLRALAATIIWLVATIYSFTAAIGFAALNRDATAEERQQQVDLHKNIETMKLSPRWQSSAACADATAPQSKQFCATYRDTEARLKSVSGSLLCAAAMTWMLPSCRAQHNDNNRMIWTGAFVFRRHWPMVLAEDVVWERKHQRYRRYVNSPFHPLILHAHKLGERVPLP